MLRHQHTTGRGDALQGQSRTAVQFIHLRRIALPIGGEARRMLRGGFLHGLQQHERGALHVRRRVPPVRIRHAGAGQIHIRQGIPHRQHPHAAHGLPQVVQIRLHSLAAGQYQLAAGGCRHLLRAGLEGMQRPVLRHQRHDFRGVPAQLLRHFRQQRVQGGNLQLRCGAKPHRQHRRQQHHEFSHALIVSFVSSSGPYDAKKRSAASFSGCKSAASVLF